MQDNCSDDDDDDVAAATEDAYGPRTGDPKLRLFHCRDYSWAWWLLLVYHCNPVATCLRDALIDASHQV